MEIVTVDMKQLSPEIHTALQHIRDVAYADGRVPGKHKLLAALAIAASVKCEPCVRMYAEKAVTAGATRDEAVEIPQRNDGDGRMCRRSLDAKGAGRI